MKRTLLVGLLALVLFVPFIGSVRLFDWDEINFAENAREMIVSGDYLHMQIDFEPFYEKPPLFIWTQVLSMKVFGVNAFAARLPNAVIGAITLMVIFSIGRRLYDERFGWLWVLAYAGSILPHFYFRSGIIDPMFNLFIFLGVLWMLKAQVERPVVNALVAGSWSACAVMTKGPVGFGLIMLTTGIAWLVNRKQTPQTSRIGSAILTVSVATITTIALGSIWFLVDYLQNGPQFVQANLAYQVRLLTTGEAGHQQPFWYHFVVVLIGCFPASLLLFGGLRSSRDETGDQRMMRIWMIVLLCVVLVVFSSVKTKIVHYSSMTYLPLTYLATIYVHRWLNGSQRWRWWHTASTTTFGVIWSVLVTVVLWAFMQREWLLSLPTFRDKFLRSSIMRNVEWLGIEPFVGVVVLAGVIAAWWLRRSNKRLASIIALYGSVIVFVSLILPLVVPRIEPYTQGAALDFYESKIGQEAYIKPVVMKSYAHLFYTHKPQHLSRAANGIGRHEWEPWLVSGSVDRPVYLVAKVNDAERWRKEPTLRVMYEEGGFVFFTRRDSADQGSTIP
ncbi:MAG: glycosyltransferase family 39 protein [Ignavibacteriae bacterium]|nr:MAG: glycosyltransferase family 39 protein [Ignavibacteriota bacterium]